MASAKVSVPFNLHRIEIKNSKDAEAAVRSVSPCEESVPLMAPKLLFCVLKLEGVRSPMANILKQEALSLGAEAAISQYSVNCSKPTSDVVLAGTHKQLRKLAAKIRMQSAPLTDERSKEYIGLSDAILGELKERH
ncbi:Uncharacterised protein [uncultured archaeon]|nr:Uncharacterised protein [uncultured archaeon]